MQAGRPSETAIAVAAMRAAHRMCEGPIGFDDPWALRLTSDSYRDLAEQGKLRTFFEGFGLKPILGQILGRARWNEEALEASLDDGIGQYVILGAGLDSFALRRPDLLDRLRCFELDHPDTQGYKLGRLKQLGVADDPRVSYVAVDFERETADEALARTAFSPELPSFFSWLGVVAYLTREDVLRMFRALRACAAPGSLVAFDYPIPPERLAGDDRALFHEIRRGSAELGEARRDTHDPDVLRAAVEALGYEQIEDLSSADHHARYFAGRGDGLRPVPQVRLARYRVR